MSWARTCLSSACSYVVSTAKTTAVVAKVTSVVGKVVGAGAASLVFIGGSFNKYAPKAPSALKYSFGGFIAGSDSILTAIVRGGNMIKPARPQASAHIHWAKRWLLLYPAIFLNVSSAVFASIFTILSAHKSIEFFREQDDPLNPPEPLNGLALDFAQAYCIYMLTCAAYSQITYNIPKFAQNIRNLLNTGLHIDKRTALICAINLFVETCVGLFSTKSSLASLNQEELSYINAQIPDDWVDILVKYSLACSVFTNLTNKIPAIYKTLNKTHAMPENMTHCTERTVTIAKIFGAPSALNSAISSTLSLDDTFENHLGCGSWQWWERLCLAVPLALINATTYWAFTVKDGVEDYARLMSGTPSSPGGDAVPEAIPTPLSHVTADTSPKDPTAEVDSNYTALASESPRASDRVNSHVVDMPYELYAGEDDDYTVKILTNGSPRNAADQPVSVSAANATSKTSLLASASSIPAISSTNAKFGRSALFATATTTTRHVQPSNSQASQGTPRYMQLRPASPE